MSSCPVPNTNANGKGDPLVIAGEDFRAVLIPIIEEQDAIREDYVASGISLSNTNQPFGGTRWIAEQVGADNRRVKYVLQQKWVTYRIAERWLIDLGLSHLLSDGTLIAVPNPSWGQEKWIKYMETRGCV